MSNTKATESSPAGHRKAAIQEVAKGRELITELRSLLLSAPHDDWRIELADELFVGISTSLTSALAALETSDFPENKDNKKSTTVARDQSIKSHGRSEAKDSWTEEQTSPKDDGNQWRKYGQKMIDGWNHPRFDPPDQSYYRCNNGDQQECQTRKKVQQKDCEGKSIFMVTYSNENTCRRMPESRELNKQESPQGETSLISFEPNTNATNQKDVGSVMIHVNKSFVSSSNESIHAELGMPEIFASTSDNGDIFSSVCFPSDDPDYFRGTTDALRLDTWPEVFENTDWFQAPK